MENALQAIRLLGNLSAQRYDWTDEDIDKMQTALHHALDVSFAGFRRTEETVKLEKTFRLGEVREIEAHATS